MGDKKISYNKRTFNEIREELNFFVQRYYPEILKDFTDSSIGSLLLDLNAAVSDNLGVNTDRAFQETQLRYAQQKDSILTIAENMGLNIPGLRPSVTVVDFTVRVPVKGDSPDESYLPTILPNSQVVGAGNVFETEDTIDFNSTVSTLGEENRSLTPVKDENGIIISYDVLKREVVKNGSTNIYKKIIRSGDIKEFYELVLPDTNVLEIESIILLDGVDYDGTPTESDFNNHEFRFYEVDYLAQQKVFIDSLDNNTTTDIKAGQWFDITKKFIKEYTSTGKCVITFGSGDIETDPFLTAFNSVGVNNKAFLDGFLKNTALGEMLKPDNTLFVKYRVGGGSSSNIPANSLTSIGLFNMLINGSRQDWNTSVRQSLKVNNPIEAIGGNDGLNVEEIRYLTKYNFSSQNRDTTINDYLLQVYKMPGKYGSPFRVNAFRENNKVVIPILGINSSGKLTNSSNSILKENISEYLAGYRMVNDYVEIRDGKILNLACDIELFVNNDVENSLANNIITAVSDFFNVQNKKMDEDVFIGVLNKTINDIDGVVNIIDMKFYNKVGGDYSLNSVSQELVSEVTGEIQLVNNTIYSTQDGMFEIKFPEKDIRIYLRKSNTNS
jgi:hypothetical protein